ncbi:hypothetical protein [Amycolatopsis sp. NPDC059021]|uniref:hypothetical protein n=1 Tax=Amycolatopsis sp. NPDC059021 TaxID=3346704 RepID=UPI0036700F09
MAYGFEEPGPEKRQRLERFVLENPDVDGGGFTIDHARTVVWLAVSDPATRVELPPELREYPVLYRPGPIFPQS